jgi:hypothetical protein
MQIPVRMLADYWTFPAFFIFLREKKNDEAPLIIVLPSFFSFPCYYSERQEELSLKLPEGTSERFKDPLADIVIDTLLEF